jgi:hypothetical protein
LGIGYKVTRKRRNSVISRRKNIVFNSLCNLLYIHHQLLVLDSSIPIQVNEITLAIPTRPILPFPNPNPRNPE